MFISPDRGLDQGDPLSNLVFPLTLAAPLQHLEDILTSQDREAFVASYQDDVPTVVDETLLGVVAPTFRAAVAPLGLSLNEEKSPAYFQPSGDPAVCRAYSGARTTTPKVMRMSADGTLATSPLIAGADGLEALIPSGSDEYAGILSRRTLFCERLVALHGAGLDRQLAQALLRAQTAGDAQFIAAATGLPLTVRRQLDDLVCSVFWRLCGLDGSTMSETHRARLFQPLRDGGFGFSSAVHYADAALTVSWMDSLPQIVREIGAPSLQALLARIPSLEAHLTCLDQRVAGALTRWYGTTPTDGMQHRPNQRSLAAANQMLALHSAQASVPDPERAVWRSGGGPGAGTFLLLPRRPAHRLDDAHFRASVQLRFHAEVLPDGLRCPFSGSESGTCGAALDRCGAHSSTCLRGGHAVGRHDDLRDTLKECLDVHGAGVVTIEQVTPQAREDATAAPRVDLVVCGVSGRTVRLDVAVTHALGVAPMRHRAAVKTDGAAARLLEDHKRGLYPGVRLTPAILETHGRMGIALLTFIRSAFAHLPADARTAAVVDTYQSLSATLQRRNAGMLLRAAAPAEASRQWKRRRSQ